MPSAFEKQVMEEVGRAPRVATHTPFLPGHPLGPHPCRLCRGEFTQDSAHIWKTTHFAVVCTAGMYVHSSYARAF